MPFPFEVPFAKINEDLDTYVDAIFGALSSEFLTLPKGNGFIEYPVFEQGYEALKRTTGDFRDISQSTCCFYRSSFDVRIHTARVGFRSDAAKRRGSSAGGRPNP